MLRGQFVHYSSTVSGAGPAKTGYRVCGESNPLRSKAHHFPALITSLNLCTGDLSVGPDSIEVEVRDLPLIIDLAKRPVAVTPNAISLPDIYWVISPRRRKGRAPVSDNLGLELNDVVGRQVLAGFCLSQSEPIPWGRESNPHSPSSDGTRIRRAGTTLPAPRCPGAFRCAISPGSRP